MDRFKPATRVWVAVVCLSAALTTVGAGSPLEALSGAWPALLILGLCAAAAHLFPIRSALGGASYQLTNVVLIVGAIVLPESLVSVLPLLAIAPERWRHRRRAGALFGGMFNVAQSILAMHAASMLAGWAGVQHVANLRDLGVLLASAATFMLVQEAVVGVVIALQTGVPIQRADTFTLPAVMSNSLLAVLGVVATGMWLAGPVLLLVAPPLLILVHRLTRTAHLAHLAEVDAKTGLHNYRHFERILDDELARSQRGGRPAAILFADLDHFKRVNDRHGHDVGDQVLREVAGLLASTLRKNDVVARWGGEEFIALLPGTDADEAVHLAERVRSAMQQHRFALENGLQIGCTISIGVATSPEDGIDSATLLKRADNAVYRAKRTRNAVARGQEIAPVEPPRSTARPPTVACPSWLASLVVWSIIASGMLAIGWGLVAVSSAAAWATLVPFLALAVVAEILSVNVYEKNQEKISLSFSVAVTMAAVAALPFGAPLVYLTGAITHAVVSRQRRVDKILFNIANPALAAAAASVVYVWLRPTGPDLSVWTLSAALAAVTAFHLVNVGLITLVISLHSGRSLPSVLRESAWYAPTKIFLGLTGAFLVVVHSQLGLLGTFMFGVPLVILRYTLAMYARQSQRTIATLEHEAGHDRLTGLPNRSRLHLRLQEAIAASGQDGPPLAFLLLDLDRFKEINDTFGHQTGDLLLQETGWRLRGLLRDADTVARLGGDEFGVVLPRTSADGAVQLAHKVLDLLGQPVLIDGQALQVGGSIGLALYPDHGLDADTLFRRADVAMYQAKQARSGYALYDTGQDDYSPERLALVGELRQAIARDELVLHYQPKVPCETQPITSVEALVRWRHPQRGLIPPDQFITLAEHTDLIKPLTQWVLDAALRQCSVWRSEGRQIAVAVNVSAHDLGDSDLPDSIPSLLARHAVPSNCLRIEITEGAVMADPTRAIEVLGAIRELGVGVSVDDFGTGYSSLSYLERLPVDELKIDRSFVKQLTTNPKQAAIVRSTIVLGHDLGLTVVAEGAEDYATWAALGQLGCDLVQGYFLSRPLPAAGLASWLDESAMASSDSRLAA